MVVLSTIQEKYISLIVVKESIWMKDMIGELWITRCVKINYGSQSDIHLVKYQVYHEIKEMH